MDAVRGILTTSVQSGLGSEQQAFLQDQSSWQPPAPPAGTQMSTNVKNSMQLNPQNSRKHLQFSHTHCPHFAPALFSSLSSAAILLSICPCSHGQSAFAGPSTRQNTAAGDTSGGASAQTPEPAHTSSSAQAVDATQHPSWNAVASAGIGTNVTGAAAASQQPAGQRQQQQQASSDSQGASGSRQDAAAGNAGRSGDGRRQRRMRRPAISPVVTMALGSLLQSTLQGDAYRDPAGVMTNAAQLLLNSHSFEGDNRQQVLVGLAHIRAACRNRQPNLIVLGIAAMAGACDA